LTKFVLFLTDFHCFGLISLERKTPEANGKGKRAVSDWKHKKALFEQKNVKLEL